MALSGPSRHQPEHSTELAPQALSGGFVRPHSTQLPWHSSTWLWASCSPAAGSCHHPGVPMQSQTSWLQKSEAGDRDRLCCRRAVLQKGYAAEGLC